MCSLYLEVYFSFAWGTVDYSDNLELAENSLLFLLLIPHFCTTNKIVTLLSNYTAFQSIMQIVFHYHKEDILSWEDKGTLGELSARDKDIGLRKQLLKSHSEAAHRYLKLAGASGVPPKSRCRILQRITVVHKPIQQKRLQWVTTECRATVGWSREMEQWMVGGPATTSQQGCDTAASWLAPLGFLKVWKWGELSDWLLTSSQVRTFEASPSKGLVRVGVHIQTAAQGGCSDFAVRKFKQKRSKNLKASMDARILKLL